MRKPRWEWTGRWGGAACAVAGCMPMLFALVAGAAGATGAQAMGSSMMPMHQMMPAAGTPGWVAALGAASWPLLGLSVALLVWSFWHTAAWPKGVAYLGVALLIVNQFDMRAWLFLPAMALLAAGFALSYARRRGASKPHMT